MSVLIPIDCQVLELRKEQHHMDAEEIVHERELWEDLEEAAEADQSEETKDRSRVGPWLDSRHTQ